MGHRARKDGDLLRGARPARRSGSLPAPAWGVRSFALVGDSKKPHNEAFPFGSIVVPAATLLFLGWLAEDVLEAGTERFDAVVRAAVHRFASPTLTIAMQAVSFLGSGVSLVALSLLTISLFLFLNWRREAILTATTMVGALTLDTVLKYAFHRPRPLPFYGTSPHSYGFPSGHALGSFCLYGALAAIFSARTSRRRARIGIWLAASVLIFLIGLSRIYLGVHYPTDVIAGYGAALVWVTAIRMLDRLLGGRSEAM
jgi:membrane-associated phospholipid phosphatase